MLESNRLVTDDQISAALAYLGLDPHPIAEAKFNLTIAENSLEQIYATLHPETEGTVKERDCDIERSAIYRDAKVVHANAVMDLERHKARIESAKMLIEVWRSLQANERASERVR